VEIENNNWKILNVLPVDLNGDAIARIKLMKNWIINGTIV
jgi:hypothetical protein